MSLNGEKVQIRKLFLLYVIIVAQLDVYRGGRGGVEWKELWVSLNTSAKQQLLLVVYFHLNVRLLRRRRSF